MQGKKLWLGDFILKRLITFLPEVPSQKQLRKGKLFALLKLKIKTEKRHQ